MWIIFKRMWIYRILFIWDIFYTEFLTFILFYKYSYWDTIPCKARNILIIELVIIRREYVVSWVVTCQGLTVQWGPQYHGETHSRVLPRRRNWLLFLFLYSLNLFSFSDEKMYKKYRFGMDSVKYCEVRREYITLLESYQNFNLI